MSRSSVGRAPVLWAGRRGFDPRRDQPQKKVRIFGTRHFRGIKGLTNPIAIELGADVFDLETAEKIALITENYAVQLSIGKNDLGAWEATLMMHSGPATVAPCKVEIIEFKCEGTPTQAIESERRKNAAHEAAAIIDMMMGF